MIKTPYDFGAVGDGATDDTAALQAFFDHAFAPANAHANVYDFEGRFAVSGPLYAAYPVDEATRRFRAGRILVLPRQGQAPIETVLTITGPGQIWQGELYIEDGQAGDADYDIRRFNTGILMMCAMQSSFEVIKVDGARRDAVKIDGRIGSWSLRVGTAYEVGTTTRNNIGIRIGSVYQRGCGSYTGSATYGHTQTVSAIEAGGDSSSGSTEFGTFSTSGSYSNSVWQRSRLTVASTAELRPYDIGKIRVELTPAHYGTITASNSASTLTLSQGDPVVDFKLVVGDKIQPQAGANSNTTFTILGFSGTSNRTIAVYPPPITEPAAANDGLNTAWSFHQITRVDSNGTQFDVYPWVPMRSNSKWHAAHGYALNIVGEDTANIHVDYVSTLLGGGGLAASGLFGPSVSTLLVESAEVGLLHGIKASSNAIGTKIGHVHIEGVTANVLQVTGGSGSRLIIEGGSDFHLSRVVPLYVRTSATDPFMLPRPLANTTIDRGGEILEGNIRGPNSGWNYFLGASALSNHPSARDATVIGAGVAVDLTFDEDVARLFGEHNRAELFWVGTGGGAPTGTLTFQLATKLSQLGWSIGGTSSVASPAKPCLFKLRFYPEGKKVLVTRFDAA